MNGEHGWTRIKDMNPTTQLVIGFDTVLIITIFMKIREFKNLFFKLKIIFIKLR